MRVFARTTRPIAAVRVATPVISRQLVLEKEPLTLAVGATLLDDQNGVVSGSVPLEIRVVDPLGGVRYDLYRATKLGTLNVTLPLAANDPAGKWIVTVRELLSDREDDAAFQFTPPARAASLAGATERAISAPGDLDNAFRFARLNHEVTIVAGSSQFDEVAAQRLTKILAPWGVRCKRMDLSGGFKATRAERRRGQDLVGLHHAGTGQIKPGDGNQLSQVGFAIDGPAILLGNSQDNPVIKYLQGEKYCRTSPVAASFPAQAAAICLGSATPSVAGWNRSR